MRQWTPHARAPQVGRGLFGFPSNNFLILKLHDLQHSLFYLIYQSFKKNHLLPSIPKNL